MGELIYRLCNFPVGSSIPSPESAEGHIIVAISSNGADMQERGAVPKSHPLVELTPKSGASFGATPKNMITVEFFSE